MKNWYYAVAFDQIKILTLKAPQSDSLILSFVKDFNVVAKKMAINRITFSSIPIFSNEFSIE